MFWVEDGRMYFWNETISFSQSGGTMDLSCQMSFVKWRGSVVFLTILWYFAAVEPVGDGVKELFAGP
jgi:hypothetical protein